MIVPMDSSSSSYRKQSLIHRIDPDAYIGIDLSPSALLGVKMLLKIDIETDELITVKAARLIDKEPVVPRKPIDIAWIVFTSGSTGEPKGIMMSHLAVSGFISGLMSMYRLLPGERYISFSPLHFDFHLLDVGLVWGSKGVLILPEQGLISNPRLLIERLSRLDIGHFSSVPSIWTHLCRHVPDSIDKLSTLKKIVFAGEEFPVPIMKQVAGKLPDTRFVNIYGQSESIACTIHEITNPLPQDMERIPVGCGHPYLRMEIRDKEGKTISTPNTVGELYVSGHVLFDGYWKNPSATQKCLLVHFDDFGRMKKTFKTGDLCEFDEDGIFYYVGRIDNQVQIYGNRVEVEEIEAHLIAHPDILDAAVAVTRDEYPVINAFVVSEKYSESVLRKYLAERLPIYMQPHSYVAVNELPRNNNGKLDRPKLGLLCLRQ